MKSAVQTIDSSRRPREIRVVQKGALRIAVPVEEGPSLTEETVERVRREIREHGS